MNAESLVTKDIVGLSRTFGYDMIGTTCNHNYGCIHVLAQYASGNVHEM